MTNSWDDTLSVIDTAALAVTATWPVGAEPSSVVEDRTGKRLFVANRISNDIAVLDAQTGVEEKRLLAGRGSSYLTLSPDGSRIYATHVYPNASRHATAGGNRTVPESEITVIDAARAVVVDRMPLHGVAASFTWRFPAMDGWARWPNIIPKILCLSRIWNTAALLPIRSRCLARMWASRSKFRWMNWSAMPRSHSAS